MNRLRALTCVFLASLTTACASPPVPTKTEYRQVYLPDRFLVDCPVPGWEPGGSFGDVAKLAARRKAALADCNLQLRSAREYQERLKAQEGALPEKTAERE